MLTFTLTIKEVDKLEDVEREVIREATLRVLNRPLRIAQIEEHIFELTKERLGAKPQLWIDALDSIGIEWS